MKPYNRPDLSNALLVSLLILTVFGVLFTLFFSQAISPGSLIGQSSAAIGFMFLLAPFLFSVMKRSALSQSPPSWFIAHVLFALLGSIFIALHVSGGNWLTPPGFVLMCLIFLFFQGVFIRVIVSKRFSLMFARSSMMRGFKSPDQLDKIALQNIINKKIDLLKGIDATQTEALFSPALKHWLKHPIKSTQYQLLADNEARMIAYKKEAGLITCWSRRLHMLIAFLFFVGLFSHIIIVLFFAGYAVQGGDIEWWYITAWGA